MLVLLTPLGQPTRKYRWEATRRVRATVSEVHSAPRGTAFAIRHKGPGIDAGLALDLTTTDEEGSAWNFSSASQRDMAEKLLDEHAPTVLTYVGCPK